MTNMSDAAVSNFEIASLVLVLHVAKCKLHRKLQNASVCDLYKRKLDQKL